MTKPKIKKHPLNRMPTRSLRGRDQADGYRLLATKIVRGAICDAIYAEKAVTRLEAFCWLTTSDVAMLMLDYLELPPGARLVNIGALSNKDVWRQLRETDGFYDK